MISVEARTVPAVGVLRDRLSGLSIAILVHVAIIAVLLNAMPKYSARSTYERETVISLPRIEKPSLPAKRQTTQGRSAISPYGYIVIPPSFQEQPNLQGLALALSSCAPEKLGEASAEVRAACERVGMAIKDNPESFGVNPGFTGGARWERELLVKQTPLLLPCMSPDANVLYTLFCVADVVGNGYDPDKMQHYRK